MKKTKLTTREVWMLAFLVILLIGITYHLGFYIPMQEDMAAIAAESVKTDEQTEIGLQRASDMKTMEAELAVILAQPKDKITEIAPYDNKEVVLNNLNGILSRTLDYSLSFNDPVVGEDGTVRRNITMDFTCLTYDSAKAVIQDLTRSKWRCLVTGCAINADPSALPEEEEEEADEDDVGEDDTDENLLRYGSLMVHPVHVNMTICFFESNKLDRNPAMTR